MYSLGCVLYEAATGQLPFDGPDAVSVAMRQVNEAPLLPSQVKPDISPDLEAIIMKAMEKKPRQPLPDRARHEARPGRLPHGPSAQPCRRKRGLGTDQRHGRRSRGHGCRGRHRGHAAAYPQATPAPCSRQRTSAWTTIRRRSRARRPSASSSASLRGIIAIAAVAMALLGGGEAKVPNVVGQTQDSAVKAIEAAGYVVGRHKRGIQRRRCCRSRLQASIPKRTNHLKRAVRSISSFRKA